MNITDYDRNTGELLTVEYLQSHIPELDKSVVHLLVELSIFKDNFTRVVQDYTTNGKYIQEADSLSEAQKVEESEKLALSTLPQLRSSVTCMKSVYAHISEYTVVEVNKVDLPFIAKAILSIELIDSVVDIAGAVSGESSNDNNPLSDILRDLNIKTNKN